MLPGLRASLTAAQLAQLDGAVANSGLPLPGAAADPQRLASFHLLADTELLMQPSLRMSTAAAAGPRGIENNDIDKEEEEQSPALQSSAGTASASPSSLRDSLRDSLRENLLPEGEGWTLCTAGGVGAEAATGATVPGATTVEPFFWNSLTGEVRTASAPSPMAKMQATGARRPMGGQSPAAQVAGVRLGKEPAAVGGGGGSHTEMNPLSPPPSTRSDGSDAIVGVGASAADAADGGGMTGSGRYTDRLLGLAAAELRSTSSDGSLLS